MNITQIDDKSILKGAKLLSEYYSIPETIEIHAQKGEKLSVSWSGDTVHITYPIKAAFFRSLTHVDMMLSKNKRENMEETVYFDECGVMFDFSRGLVMNVEGLKKYASYMARMGINTIYLYTEDTYEVKEFPYLGYMRGRYTKEEIAEMDEYCDSIGVELIPHIQALGHMGKFLMWDEGAQFRDTIDVLHPDDENTFEFIKKAILTVSSYFKTNKIHLGMDEAGNLGSGRYYAKHGAVDRKDIFLDHLKKVVDFTVECGLVPIIYDDTLDKVLSGNQFARSANTEIPKSVTDRLPKGFVPAYWNYYSEDINVYKQNMELYRKMAGDVIFWGGIWTWRGAAYDAVMTERLSNPGLMACKELGIRKAIGSIWGNSGECNYIHTIHGSMYFAEHMYSVNVNTTLLKERFEFITKAKYDAFIEMSYYHNDYDNENNYKSYIERYWGKRYFWADVLLGLLDYDLSQKPMASYYAKTAEKFKRFLDKNDSWYEHYLLCYKFFDILSKKCYIAENLKTAYDENNLKFLSECVQTFIPELIFAFEETSALHKKLWFEMNKPFGYEVEDIKYGGMIKRLHSAKERLSDYLEGKICKIEELEETRLSHTPGGRRVDFSAIMSAKGEII
ncbi:MAG: family 20 glycosylhydrolase [Clostridia bacterium]|nr:family 20 glycosylhydrolase [Clostridia bacterium]